MAKKLFIKQMRSLSGRPDRHIATIEALGLKRIGHTVVKQDTPQMRGMIAQVKHMVSVTEE